MQHVYKLSTDMEYKDMEIFWLQASNHFNYLWCWCECAAWHSTAGKAQCEVLVTWGQTGSNTLSDTASLVSTWSTKRSAWGPCANRTSIWKVRQSDHTSTSMSRCMIIHMKKSVCLLLPTAELCRELSGWPRRFERSTNRKRCRSRRSNPKTWANKAWWAQDGVVTTGEDGAS